ncbi:MAG: hypothetical protein GY852_00740 [bacterium]|nr:hypothetical protein [bacterium]
MMSSEGNNNRFDNLMSSNVCAWEISTIVVREEILQQKRDFPGKGAKRHLDIRVSWIEGGLPGAIADCSMQRLVSLLVAYRKSALQTLAVTLYSP